MLILFYVWKVGREDVCFFLLLSIASGVGLENASDVGELAVRVSCEPHVDGNAVSLCETQICAVSADFVLVLFDVGLTESLRARARGCIALCVAVGGCFSASVLGFLFAFSPYLIVLFLELLDDGGANAHASVDGAVVVVVALLGDATVSEALDEGVPLAVSFSLDIVLEASLEESISGGLARGLTVLRDGEVVVGEEEEEVVSVFESGSASLNELVEAPTLLFVSLSAAFLLSLSLIA